MLTVFIFYLFILLTVFKSFANLLLGKLYLVVLMYIILSSDFSLPFLYCLHFNNEDVFVY